MKRTAALLGLTLAVSCASEQVRGTSAPEVVSDPAGSLVQTLVSGELEDRESAMAGLISLGPDALSAIRGARDRFHDPEFTLRLNTVIERLEEQERLIKLVGRPALIRFSARGIRVRDALKELARQSGVPVDGSEIPDDRIDVDLGGVPIWIAVDDVCRTHGGLQPEWLEDRVIIRPGHFLDTPSVEWKIGPIPMGRFCLDYASVKPTWLKRPVLEARPRLILRPGKRLFGMVLFLDEARDTHGKSLFEGEDGTVSLQDGNRFTSSRAILVDSKRLLPDVRLPSDQGIRASRGTAYFYFSPATKRLAVLNDLTPKARAQDPESGVSIYIFEVKREPGSLRIHYEVTYPMLSDGSRRIEGPEGIRVLTATGESIHPHQVEDYDSGGSMGATERVGTALFAIPSECSIVAIEVFQPTEHETVEIEFDFRRLPVAQR